MRYLWQTPLQLDNAKLVAFLGAEPHTELDEAVRTAITGLRGSADVSVQGRRVNGKAVLDIGEGGSSG